MALQDIQIWQLLAGLGLFLFGMFMLEEALKALAGRAFKIFLRKHTGNPIKAVLSGTFMTIILQSSSMVSLLVMSFAGAGIIGLRNGIGMILGANLGTTAKGWLVSIIGFKFDIESFIFPFLAIGGLGIIFLKSDKLSNLSKLLMGFSLIFLGLNFMHDGFSSFADNMDVSFLTGKNPLLFVGFGIILAASIQSSSAAMMLVLSSLAVNMITLEQGAYLVIGGDLGTTVTALIGTLKGNEIRRKVGFSQFYFNLFSAIFAFSALPFLLYTIREYFNVTDPLIAVVFFHSLFNLLGIILILPFLGLFTKFIDKIVRSKEKKQSSIIRQASSNEPFAATVALEKETILFIQRTVRVNRAFFKSKGNSNNEYFLLKSYEDEIVQFYIPLLQNPLTQKEAKKINLLIAAVRNATLSAKDLKDIHHNINSLRSAVSDEYNAWFSEIRMNQKSLYQLLKQACKQLIAATSPELESIKDFQNSIFRKENESLYLILSKMEVQEIDTPSLFNLIGEINHSNESLLKAIRLFVQAKGIEIAE